MIHSDILRAHRVPLCVDLDHTLVRCDLLHEGMLQVAKTAPWRLVAMARKDRVPDQTPPTPEKQAGD